MGPEGLDHPLIEPEPPTREPILPRTVMHLSLPSATVDGISQNVLKQPRMDFETVRTEAAGDVFVLSADLTETQTKLGRVP